MNPSSFTPLFRPLGGWMLHLERPQPLPPLEGEVSADVVIAGAGVAGLNTALELAAQGAKVVVLERETVGFGASGRNAGYLVGGQGLEYDYIIRSVGREQAKHVVRFYDDGVAYVERKLGEYSIDCDYNASGIIRAAVHPSQEKKLLKSMKTGMELGSPAQFLDQAAMRARGIPPAFLFGAYLPSGGTLDPGKYVQGLRCAALKAGVKIYEGTALQSWSGDRVIQCITEKGKVSAPHLVLATNAYTPQLGLLRDKVMPVRVSAIETQPLSPEQLASLGWPRREGIITSHWTMESHRLTARNSLVVTTKRLNYAYGSQAPNVPDDAAYRELAVALHDRFPTLQGIGLRACWSGYVSLAYDFLPVVGETGSQRNVFYTAGCSGHGVATQSLMGQLLAERIRGSEHPLLAALRHKSPNTLPEPLQWCTVKAAFALTNLADDHVNRKVRRAAGR